jgi:hypothetical protein
MADPYGVVVFEIEAERQRIEEGLKAAEAMFRNAIATASVPGEWIAELGYPSLAIVAEATGAHLIVLGQVGRGFANDAFASMDIGDVIMSSGRPVLVLPPTLKSATFDRVLIAWKDTRETRRAVADALPFLKAATHSTLAQIISDEAAHRPTQLPPARNATPARSASS